MRILIHDYSGHPFQVQLSRALAGRGHIVRHVFCASFQTPRGNLSLQPDDPDTLEIRAVALDKPFLKEAFFRRRAQEIKIGELVADQIIDFRPEIVVSSNAPLDTQRLILAATRKLSAKFVFWLQDVYSEAIRRILSKKVPGIGALVGMIYQSLEYSMLRNSDHVIPIAADFLPLLEKRKVARERMTVIENWAPIDEMVPVEWSNDWAATNMPHPGLRVVYSGTLGYKHNPQLLIDLAKRLDGHLYVFSEGRAAEGLRAQAASQGLSNVHVKGWVPFEDLPKMLSGADAFVAVIEKDAGVFSVPSKVLSYLCIGRPIIGFIPQCNLARTIILREGAGIAGDPDDFDALAPSLDALFAKPEQRAAMGANGCRYAEKTFDIGAITERFETVFAGL